MPRTADVIEGKVGKFPGIHKAITDAMAAKNWRAADLIRAMNPGVAKPKATPSVYAYIYGRTIPRDATKQLLAKVLDIPIEVFSEAEAAESAPGNGRGNGSNGATEVVKKLPRAVRVEKIRVPAVTREVAQPRAIPVAAPVGAVDVLKGAKMDGFAVDDNKDGTSTIHLTMSVSFPTVGLFDVIQALSSLVGMKG